MSSSSEYNIIIKNFIYLCQYIRQTFEFRNLKLLLFTASSICVQVKKKYYFAPHQRKMGL